MTSSCTSQGSPAQACFLLKLFARGSSICRWGDRTNRDSGKHGHDAPRHDGPHEESSINFPDVCGGIREWAAPPDYSFEPPLAAR
jgi:hypothetical protein